jgi:hypothetical protein
MGLSELDRLKVPKGLPIREYYKRIYEWYMKNKDKILNICKDPDSPYVSCYLELLNLLPDPSNASLEDIVLVCMEVMVGLMEWSYHKTDENGVKLGAYAEYVFNNLFEGVNGKKTIHSYITSKLYPDYFFTNYMKNIQNSNLKYL